MIRERTVADQGYDTFREEIIRRRGHGNDGGACDGGNGGAQTAAGRSGDGDDVVTRSGKGSTMKAASIATWAVGRRLPEGTDEGYRRQRWSCSTSGGKGVNA